MITLLKQLLLKSRHIILYGALLAILVFVLKWLQWKFLITDHSLEIYIGLIALFFTVLGVWLATQLAKPKVEKVVVEKEVYLELPEEGVINKTELEKLELTDREYDVLELLSKGQTNAEIAGNLFLSVSTVKTHVSNLFVKMDIKNRAQAVEKAKRLKLVP